MDVSLSDADRLRRRKGLDGLQELPPAKGMAVQPGPVRVQNHADEEAKASGQEVRKRYRIAPFGRKRATVDDVIRQASRTIELINYRR